jgi:hypothetical protein
LESFYAIQIAAQFDVHATVHACFPVVAGVGHNIESGKDFTVDGLSGFNKKKKKKRRHR